MQLSAIQLWIASFKARGQRLAAAYQRTVSVLQEALAQVRQWIARGCLEGSGFKTRAVRQYRTQDTQRQQNQRRLPLAGNV